MNVRNFFGLVLLFTLGCGGEQRKPDASPETAQIDAKQAGNQAALIAPKPLTEAEMAQVLTDTQAFIDNGDFRAAEDTLEKALLSDVQGEFLYYARYNLGVLCERRGAYQEAMRHFDKARAIKPEAGDAVLALARLYVRQGQLSTGIDLMRTALSGVPDSVALRNALNRVLVDNNRDLDEVIASSKAILSKQESNAEAKLNLAAAFQQQGRHDMALAVLDVAQGDFEKDNGEGSIWSDLTWRRVKSLLALEFEAEAMSALRRATESPKTATPELHNMLGILELKKGNSKAAELNFRKAIEMSPEMIEACVNLSHALKGLTEYDQALSTLNRCSDMSGNDVNMLYNLGILYLDGSFTRIKGVQQYERAKSYFEEFLSKSSDEKYKTNAVKYLELSARKIKKEKKKAELKAKLDKMRKAKEAREAAAAANGDGADVDSDADADADGEDETNDEQ